MKPSPSLRDHRQPRQAAETTPTWIYTAQGSGRRFPGFALRELRGDDIARSVYASPGTCLAELSDVLRNCWYVIAWDTSPATGFFRAPSSTSRSSCFAPRTALCRAGRPLLPPPCAAFKGRKEGDNVRCGYHGLKFDAGGRCVEPGPRAQRRATRWRCATSSSCGWAIRPGAKAPAAR